MTTGETLALVAALEGEAARLGTYWAALRADLEAYALKEMLAGCQDDESLIE